MNDEEDFQSRSQKKKDINDILNEHFKNNGFEISEQEEIFEKNGKNLSNFSEPLKDIVKPLSASSLKIHEKINGVHLVNEIKKGRIVYLRLCHKFLISGLSNKYKSNKKDIKK